MKQRINFWSERVHSQRAVTIPERIRMDKFPKKRNMRCIVGELIREPEFCKHVHSSIPPILIWGLPPSMLRDREQFLYDASMRVEEEYVRRGSVHRRRQKSTTPILLVAVASWPEPTMENSPARDRWEKLVVEACLERWGVKCRGIYAHIDETYFHLHIWVDDDGFSIKPLHVGHSFSIESASKGESRKAQAEAYVEGCIAGQDWFHHLVGGPCGWLRRSDAPRPRLIRAAALRNRQAELERQETEVIEKAQAATVAKVKLEEQAQELRRRMLTLISNEAQVIENDKAVAAAAGEVGDMMRHAARKSAELNVREAKLREKHAAALEYAAILKRMRAAVEDQLELERRLRNIKEDNSGEVDYFS